MKPVIGGVILIVLISIFYLSADTASVLASPASTAESSSVVLPIQQRTEEIRNRINTRLTLQESLRQEGSASNAAQITLRQQKRLNLIRMYFQRMVNRLKAAIIRLEKLTDRLNLRLAVYKTADPTLDTAEIEQNIKAAQTLLEDAKTDLTAAEENIELVLTSEYPQEAFVEVKNLIKSIKTKLVEVHRLLVQLIGDLRGLRVGSTVNQTTEPKGSPKPAETLNPTTPTPTLTPSALPILTPIAT